LTSLSNVYTRIFSFIQAPIFSPLVFYSQTQLQSERWAVAMTEITGSVGVNVVWT